MSTRLLVADDHTIIRDGLQSVLTSKLGVDIVGKAREGREAVKMAIELRPDVVLMDLSMPGMGGIAATREIVAALPEVKVLCLSVHADRQFVYAALDAGASGYILKDHSIDELVRAVRAVVEGGAYLSPAISDCILTVIRGKRSGKPKISGLKLLTNREVEVLQMIAEGYSTQETAERLHLSPKTVGTHRDNLKSKLHLRGVAGLTKFAIREGLTSPDE